MSINFYLKAETQFGGRVCVKEWFEFRTHGTIKKDNGEIPDIFIDGYVDEDIRRAHPKEYATFAETVQKNDAALYEYARSHVGAKVLPSDVLYPEPLVVEGEEKENEK